MTKFKENQYSTNYVLDLDGKNFISFQPLQNPFGFAFFAADTAEGETAIVTEDDYRILNGDWRKEYEKLAEEGLEACIKFYEENKVIYGSSWSTL